MPHRPQGQGSTTVASSGGDTSLYTPPRVPGTAAASIMRQPSGAPTASNTSTNPAVAAAMYEAARSAAGVVTPLVSANKWLSAGAASTLNHPAALMPSLDSRNKSTDSADTRSMGNTSHDAASVATLATEDDREATASALLMVAKAAEREHLNNMIHAASLAASSGSCSSAVMPLKKRKNRQQNDVAAGDEDEEDSMSEATEKEVTASQQDPCHISPVSHSSAEHGLRAESTDDSTPTRRIVPPSRANRTSSYDSKDLPLSYRALERKEASMELLDSAKVHSTAQIGAPKPPSYPSQVLIPHFPTILHQALSDKECEHAIQWLADGEAWKVLRWDGLRRQVLPRYFADLRDENGGACGTIDAFLFHLSAWGFEEIKDGTAMGAYRHDLFIRGAQKLCVKMRFTGDMVEDNKGPKPVSPHQIRTAEAERSMLQVPTLTAMEMADAKLPPHKRARYEGSSPIHGPLHWPYGDSPAVWGGQFLSEAPHLYNMRASSLGGQYQGPSYGADPRMPIRRSSTPESLPPAQQYTPPQVRSGRGAMRITNRAATSPSTTPVVRQGISVSNRGKGPRKPAAVRSTLASSPATVAQKPDGAASPMTTQEPVACQSVDAAQTEAERVGNSVQGAAFAISRKLKRKLPMASKKTEDSEHGAETITTPGAAQEPEEEEMVSTPVSKETEKVVESN